MKVVFCATRNYFGRLTVAIRALLKTTPSVETVYVLSDTPFPEGGKIKNIVVDGTKWFGNSPNRYCKWTIVSLYRLAMHHILDEDKILYMDCDCICNDDIGELWTMDIKSRLVAGAREPRKSGEALEYVNAGVLLMDLKRFRESGVGDRMIEVANMRQYDFPDQDVLNQVVMSKYILNCKWNMCEWTGWSAEPKIMHYAAYPNYMNGECKHPEIIRRWIADNTNIYSL